LTPLALTLARSFYAKKEMKLQKIYLRYFPPGLAFNYIKNNNAEETKCVDVFDLTAKSDLDMVVAQLKKRDPKIFTKDILPQVYELLEKMQKKLCEPQKNKFYLYKTLQTHILPLTNVDFDRSGQKCITGSYDRTCRIWNVETGDEMNVLKGHENVVFSVAFNYPKCDKIVTGSFDKTAKIWNVSSGACLNTLWGHTGEIVGAEFNKNSDMICTSSMDGTAILWSSETAQEINSFRQHTAEVISCHFNSQGSLLITGSFDEHAMVWDIREKDPVHILRGHDAELSNSIWNFSYDLIATSSLDGTAKIWDLRQTKTSLFTLKHSDEILDICFDYTGKIATCSSDCTAKVWSEKGDIMFTLEGHIDEISKVAFSPNGCLLLTASADKTARIWHVNSETENGLCLQVLQGHDNELFSCAFNYSGDAILTASKDNTCKLYR
jgi:dynein assembly factor with WDR repeat domains 1